jgi:hypothetical protein
MGLRFYRRIRLFPGVTLNLSRRGVSTSVGVRGAHLTVGHGKVRTTVGLPGSGLSYTKISKSADNALQEASSAISDTTKIPKGNAWRGLLWIALLVAVAVFAFMAPWT